MFNLMQGINQNRHEQLIALIIELESALEAEITTRGASDMLINTLSITKAQRIEMQGGYVMYSKMLSDLRMQIAEYNNTYAHLRFYLRQQVRDLNKRAKVSVV